MLHTQRPKNSVHRDCQRGHFYGLRCIATGIGLSWGRFRRPEMLFACTSQIPHLLTQRLDTRTAAMIDNVLNYAVVIFLLMLFLVAFLRGEKKRSVAVSKTSKG